MSYPDSIELRWPVGPNDDYICEWGVVTYPDPRPALGQVGHLIITHGWWVGGLLRSGEPHYYDLYGWVSAISEGELLFFRMEYGGKRWVWQLFEAHLKDEKGTNRPLLLGRWPD